MRASLAAAWLKREDQIARKGRLARLRWMERNMPQLEWMGFSGGMHSKYLFEETRYCYAYGQFLASILLGMAFIETSLAATFYASGRNDLERTGIAALAKEALACGWLARKDFDTLERVRNLRNPITHFRAPSDPARIEIRAYHLQSHGYAVIEADAKKTMEAVFHLITKICPFSKANA